MPTRPNRRRLLALGVIVALLASACGTPGDQSAPTAGKRGGTLNLLAQSEFEHLDPARNYVASQQHLALLYAPTLTSYVNRTGVAGNVIAPDAATTTGTHNADASVWSFTIRKNLKWQDGKPVTCEDFRYGVNRSFAPTLTDGPSYQKVFLKGGDSYKGIYEQKAGIPSVTCTGDTITYQLKQPVADFNYTVTMGIFAAVRADMDTKTKYDEKPFSYGPYMIKSHVIGQSLVLVRNPYWDQSQDQIRKNLPDTFNIQFGQDATVINDRLINDRGPDQQAITFGNTQVQAQQAEQVFGSPQLRKRTVSGLSGFVWYLAINTKKVPDLKCRQAYQYVMNKRTYLLAFGGPRFGDYATTIVAPTLTAYRKIDPYGLASKPEGDVAKAQQALAAAATCPRTVKLDYSQTPTTDRMAAAIREAFGRIGVTVVPNPIPRKQFYATAGRSEEEHELVYAGWGADWSSGAAVLGPLFDGKQIAKTGNQNYAQLNDPAINEAIYAAQRETNFDKAQPMWAAIDEKVQQASAIIPLRYEKAVYIVGSKVTGAQMHAVYSDISLLNVGVQP
ncbi:ABC transporter substrate-binding protein [Fodinicola acaciae]|uniref:ABC transporter substrate-binding protein n=1 Tax=Fodinicola acaciae TaxID=2681555 RepID=UPI0013D3A7F5|nr:ABC transporter substrate-binding protein [Fodinicola acaciae]